MHVAAICMILLRHLIAKGRQRDIALYLARSILQTGRFSYLQDKNINANKAQVTG